MRQAVLRRDCNVAIMYLHPIPTRLIVPMPMDVPKQLVGPGGPVTGGSTSTMQLQSGRPMSPDADRRYPTAVYPIPLCSPLSYQPGIEPLPEPPFMRVFQSLTGQARGMKFLHHDGPPVAGFHPLNSLVIAAPKRQKSETSHR